jgi:hypothetical protein
LTCVDVIPPIGTTVGPGGGGRGVSVGPGVNVGESVATKINGVVDEVSNDVGLLEQPAIISVATITPNEIFLKFT